MSGASDSLCECGLPLTPARLAEIREHADEDLLDLVDPQEMYALLAAYESFTTSPRSIPRRFWLADYVGGDWVEGGFFVYLGPLMVRWQWRRRG